MEQEKVVEKNEDIRLPDGKVLAVLAYLGVLIIIPFLVAKDDDFVGFHLRQGVILFIIIWLFFLASTILPVASVTMANLTIFLNSIILLFIFLLTLNGIMNVLNGEKKELPFVGILVKKFDI